MFERIVTVLEVLNELPEWQQDLIQVLTMALFVAIAYAVVYQFSKKWG
jgi:hypothetical protein